MTIKTAEEQRAYLKRRYEESGIKMCTFHVHESLVDDVRKYVEKRMLEKGFRRYARRKPKDK